MTETSHLAAIQNEKKDNMRLVYGFIYISGACPNSCT